MVVLLACSCSHDMVSFSSSYESITQEINAVEFRSRPHLVVRSETRQNGSHNMYVHRIEIGDASQFTVDILSKQSTLIETVIVEQTVNSVATVTPLDSCSASVTEAEHDQTDHPA